MGSYRQDEFAATSDLQQVSLGRTWAYL